MKKVFILIIAVIALASFTTVENAKTTKNSNKANTTSSTISGSVLDINGEPLAGAEIAIKGENNTIYSDFDGNFQLKDLKPGKYSIIVSYLAHTNSLIDVEIKSENINNNIEIKLKEN